MNTGTAILIGSIIIIVVAAIFIVIFILIDQPWNLKNELLSSAPGFAYSASDVMGKYGVKDVYVVNLNRNDSLHPCYPGSELISQNLNHDTDGFNMYMCQERGEVSSLGIQDVTTIYGDNPHITCPDGYEKDPTNFNAGASNGKFSYLCKKYGLDKFIQDINVIRALDNQKIECPRGEYYPRGQDINVGTGGRSTFICVQKIHDNTSFNPFKI